MKRLVVLLVVVLAIFTFLRDFPGTATASELSGSAVSKAELIP